MNQDSRRTLLILGFIIVCLVCVVVFVRFQQHAREQTASSQVATTTKAGVYTALNEQPVAIHDTTAEYTVVFSWASWCPQCAELLPAYATLAEQYQDKPYRFVAVNRAEPRVRVEQYLAQTLPNYESGPVEILQDSADTFYDSVDAYAMPEVVIYDQQFVPVARNAGERIVIFVQQFLNDHERATAE